MARLWRSVVLEAIFRVCFVCGSRQTPEIQTQDRCMKCLDLGYEICVHRLSKCVVACRASQSCRLSLAAKGWMARMVPIMQGFGLVELWCLHGNWYKARSDRVPPTSWDRLIIVLCQHGFKHFNQLCFAGLLALVDFGLCSRFDEALIEQRCVVMMSKVIQVDTG